MSKDTLEAEPQANERLVVRQPIFDRDKSIWGYEFVTNEAPALPGNGDDSPLSNLVSSYKDNLAALGSELSDDKKLVLSLDNEAYLNASGLSEEMAGCAFGVSGDAACSELCKDFAETLREKGCTVVLDSETEPSVFEGLVDRCDVIKVSLEGKTPPEIVKIRSKFKSFSGKLLATDICSWEAFEGTRALGFKYFQGPFFAVPKIDKDADLPASSIAKLQLLRELSNPECDMEDLASIIAGDVSLSYRILKYINSASFGLKNKIKSIQQAVSLLGLKELKHWSTVVVMTDLDSTPKGEELAYMALQRGRFLSKLAESIKGFKHSPNTMFMLGLFSKLDALLSYPMDKALEDIPLEEDIKDGLCGTLNEFRDWLRVLEAIEIGNWGIANQILGRYGACFTQAATQYMKASSWAAKQLPDMKK